MTKIRGIILGFAFGVGFSQLISLLLLDRYNSFVLDMDTLMFTSSTKSHVIEDSTSDKGLIKEEREREFSIGDERYTAANDTDICSNMSQRSAASIWKENLNKIFHASRHRLDKEDEFIWHDFTARLLYYMSPQRLITSIKTIPIEQMEKVGYILDISYARYKYLQDNNVNQKSQSPTARKLNILVLGGSVTMGVNCHKNPVQETSRFARRDCAWPSRLQSFFDLIFPGVVDVTQVTLGGTNTESGITIWDYFLLPQGTPYPDIVIHGYATNDMHVLSENEAMARNLTLEDMILKINQDFVRLILKPQKNCDDRPSPLLLYVDDYIGNEQHEILRTTSFSRAITLLSNYYGFGYVSYADAIRTIVYGDTSEEWFSADGWPLRNVHPGMGAHISMTWILAYNMLNIASVYCDRLDNTGNEHAYNALGGLPVLRRSKILHGEPKPHLRSLPPPLSFNLTLDEISQLWRKDMEVQYHLTNTTNCSSFNFDNFRRPCSWSWVGGLERSFDKPKALDARMKDVMEKNDGWESTADSGKLGFSSSKHGARFILHFPKSDRVIQTLNFMVMTSYGDKWKDSRVLVEAFVSDSEVFPTTHTKSIEILGFHDKHTSETYNYKLDLGSHQVKPGESLRVQVTLIGGSAFKFMGMAMCDH